MSSVAYLAWNRAALRRPPRESIRAADAPVSTLAAAIVGGLPEECPSVASSPHEAVRQLLSDLYEPKGHRLGVVVDERTSDEILDAAGTELLRHGLAPSRRLARLQPRPGEAVARSDDVADFLVRYGHEYSIAWLAAVDPVTGTLADLAGISAAARSAGCTIGWDLTGAAGVVPLELHDWGVDFAIWNRDAYLGPADASHAGCFVHRRHLDRVRLMTREPPAGDSSTVAAVAAAGLGAVRHDSISLTEYLCARVDELARSHECELLSPRDPHLRGAHVSVRVRKGSAAAAARTLADEHHVIVATAGSDAIVLAPSPIYSTQSELERAMDALAAVLPLRQAITRSAHRR